MRQTHKLQPTQQANGNTLRETDFQLGGATQNTTITKMLQKWLIFANFGNTIIDLQSTGDLPYIR